MTFVSPFRAPVSAPFPSQTAAATASWWLSGGVTAAQCIAAHRAKGAASLAASYVNLNNPGTYDAIESAQQLNFSSSTGWIGLGQNQTKYLSSTITPSATQGFSAIVRFSNVSGSAYFFGCNYGSVFTTIRSHNGVYFFANASGLTTPNNAIISSGVLCVAGNKAYVDGVDQGISMTNVVGTPITINVFGINLDGSNFGYAVSIQAIAFYNIALSAAQVLAITTAMQAL